MEAKALSRNRPLGLNLSLLKCEALIVSLSIMYLPDKYYSIPPHSHSWEMAEVIMEGRFMPTRCWAVMIKKKKVSTHYMNPIDHFRKQKMVLLIDFAWLPNALGPDAFDG